MPSESVLAAAYPEIENDTMEDIMLLEDLAAHN